MQSNDCIYSLNEFVCLNSCGGNSNSDFCWQCRRRRRCRRCRAVTYVVGPYPYCTECNWDSLSDMSCEKTLCAA